MEKQHERDLESEGQILCSGSVAVTLHKLVSLWETKLKLLVVMTNRDDVCERLCEL